MITLAIETATGICGAAVIEKGAVLGEASIAAPHIHSEKLISLVDEALGNSCVGPERVDGIAVSAGPGSFTGLRIGLSVAKGLAYAWGKPIVSVLTLKALAFQAVRQSLSATASVILPMIDARRQELYIAAYRCAGGELREILRARSAVLEEVIPLVPEGEPVVVMGDGADKFDRWLSDAHPLHSSRFIIPPFERRLCSAAAVGLLGEQEFTEGHAADLAALEPLYVKDFPSLLRERHIEAHS